jgi:hypothetical protein
MLQLDGSALPWGFTDWEGMGLDGFWDTVSRHLAFLYFEYTGSLSNASTFNPERPEP